MQISAVYESAPNLLTSVMYRNTTNHSNEQQMGLTQWHLLHALSWSVSQQIQIGFCVSTLSNPQEIEMLKLIK